MENWVSILAMILPLLVTIMKDCSISNCFIYLKLSVSLCNWPLVVNENSHYNLERYFTFSSLIQSVIYNSFFS